MHGWVARWPLPGLRGRKASVHESSAVSALPPGRRAQARGLVLALGLAVALSLLLLLVRRSLSTANVALLYLVPVLVSSTLGGLLPAAVVAVACVLALNLLFVVPYGTLNIANAQDSLTLLLFLGVAVLTSELAAQARARAEEASRRERATALLYDLSSTLVASDLDVLLGGLVERLSHIFSLHSCTVLLADAEGRMQPRAHGGRPLMPVSAPAEREMAAAAEWALKYGTRVGLTLNRPVTVASRVPRPRMNQSTRPAPQAALFIPLNTAGHAVGLLRLVSEHVTQLVSEDERLLETFATQAALAIERAQFAQESAHAAVLRESDRAKSALLSSVSHELRTPLAIIRGAADALGQPAVAGDVAMRDELLSSIREESDVLSALVANLLDLSRIEAGAMRPQKHLYDLVEIASRAAARLAPRLAGHRFSLDLPPDGPLVPVDYMLISAVLTNLLDNAAKYAPPGTAVRLRLCYHDNVAVLAVEDEGPGIPPADRERVFTKFYRVPGRATQATPGTGLGLAICKGIVEAHGGTIMAEAPAGVGGARMVVRLPRELVTL